MNLPRLNERVRIISNSSASPASRVRSSLATWAMAGSPN